MGVLDRFIRVILAFAAALLIFLNIFSDSIVAIAGSVSIILLITSLFGTCPLYIPFGFRTIKTD
jgi:hypothetical protein